MKRLALWSIIFASGFATCWVLLDAKANARPKPNGPQWPLEMPMVVIVQQPENRAFRQYQLRVVRSHKPGEPVEFADNPGDRAQGNIPPVWVFRFCDRVYSAEVVSVEP